MAAPTTNPKSRSAAGFKSWPLLTLLAFGLAGCDLNIELETSMSVVEAVQAGAPKDFAHVAVEIEMPSRAKCREIGPKVTDVVGDFLREATGGTCVEKGMNTFLRITGNIGILGTDQNTLEPSGATMLELIVQRPYRQLAVLVDQAAFTEMMTKIADLFHEPSVDLEIADLGLKLENDTRESRSVKVTHVFANGVPTLAREIEIAPRAQIELKFSDVHRASLEKQRGLSLLRF